MYRIRNITVAHKKTDINHLLPQCECKDCPLYGSKELSYRGNKNAQILFVGESPSLNDYKNNTILSERTDEGKFLQLEITKAKIPINNSFFVLASRCRIDKKILSNKSITETLSFCRSKLSATIHKIKPKVIVVFGDLAMRQIIKKSGITKQRGLWIWSEEYKCWVFPMFSAAYILRNLGVKNLFIDDLILLKNFINNNYSPPKDSFKLDLIINDTQKFYEIYNLWERGVTIAIDTETQGKDWCSPNFLTLSYSISDSIDRAFQMQLYEEFDERKHTKHDFCITVDRAPDGKAAKVSTSVKIVRSPNFKYKILLLKKILEDINVKKYMMTTYDLHAFDALFQRENIEYSGVKRFSMELQTGANVFDENIFMMSSLENLQMALTNFKENYNHEFGLQFDKSDMLKVHKEHTRQYDYYSGMDAVITRAAGLSIKNKLIKDPGLRLAKYFANFAMPTVQVALYTLEKNGVLFDSTKLESTKEEVGNLAQQYHSDTVKCIPRRVIENHNSKGIKLSRTDLVRDVLFSQDGFRLPPMKSTKTGISVDKEARSKLKDSGRLSGRSLQFMVSYEKYLEANTLYSRNLKNFNQYIKPDGRIHSRQNIAMAKTGRVSSSDPNVMNFPKRSELAYKIRELIVAPKNKLFIASDQSQSELRWIAHVANDPAMIDVFLKGQDIHTNTAIALSTKKWDTLDDKERSVLRRRAKAVNFGLIYGMSLKGFIQYAKVEYGIDLTDKEGAKWVALFFSLYKQLKVYHHSIVEFCRVHGYVESCFGRRRRLPEINSKDMYIRGQAERMAINHPIQSPSSDTVLMACNKMLSCEINPEECRPVLFIHDELIFEVAENKIDTYAPIIKYSMENPGIDKAFGVTLRVPLVAGIKCGNNLSNLKEIN